MTCSGNTSLSPRYRHAAELFGLFRCSPGVFCFGFVRCCAETVLSVTFTWKNVEVSSEVWAVNNTAVNQKQPMKTRRGATELTAAVGAQKEARSVGSCWRTCASQPGTTSHQTGQFCSWGDPPFLSLPPLPSLLSPTNPTGFGRD